MSKEQISSRELSQFCEQYALILKSGTSGEEGLRILLEDSRTDRSRSILKSLLDYMEDTGSLCTALEKSGLFPDYMISYTKVGEETGCLDEVMDSLASYYQQESDVSDYVRSAVSYPLLMLGMMCVVIGILLVKVLPVFQQVFRQMGLEMNGISGGLLKAGSSMGSYFMVILVIALAAAAVIVWLCFTSKGKQALGTLKQRLPGIRKISEASAYSRLSMGMALGLRSGLGPERSLEMAALLTTHPLLREKLDKAKALLEEGELFSQALTDSGLFEGMSARLICVGFRAGAADEVMEKLSLRYQESAMNQVGHLVSIVEPTIVIILSLLVGLVLLSVIMPLLGLLSEMMV